MEDDVTKVRISKKDITNKKELPGAKLKIIDENGEVHEKRLSNGPIESFNRIPKDMKRNSRGYLDFEHARNRILFATRKNPTITSPKK
mgnify:CR=1 FL=1